MAYIRLFVECPVIRVNRPCSIANSNKSKDNLVNRQMNSKQVQTVASSETLQTRRTTHTGLKLPHNSTPF